MPATVSSGSDAGGGTLAAGHEHTIRLFSGLARCDPKSDILATYLPEDEKFEKVRPEARKLPVSGPEVVQITFHGRSSMKTRPTAHMCNRDLARQLNYLTVAMRKASIASG